MPEGTGDLRSWGRLDGPGSEGEQSLRNVSPCLVLPLSCRCLSRSQCVPDRLTGAFDNLTWAKEHGRGPAKKLGPHKVIP